MKKRYYIVIIKRKGILHGFIRLFKKANRSSEKIEEQTFKIHEKEA